MRAELAFNRGFCQQQLSLRMTSNQELCEQDATKVKKSQKDNN